MKITYTYLKMKKRVFLLMAVVLCGLATYAETNPRPFTVPAIREWKGGVGKLALTADSRILYADSRLRAAAEMLAQDLQNSLSRFRF